jgi:hypothetical protein
MLTGVAVYVVMYLAGMMVLEVLSVIGEYFRVA